MGEDEIKVRLSWKSGSIYERVVDRRRTRQHDANLVVNPPIPAEGFLQLPNSFSLLNVQHKMVQVRLNHY